MFFLRCTRIASKAPKVFNDVPPITVVTHYLAPLLPYTVISWLQNHTQAGGVLGLLFRCFLKS